jgi:ParB-like chromosome segregation protein Spo0J
MDIQNIEVVRIGVGSRKRPVSPEKVADIQRSIAQQGLLQPIGVKPEGDGFRLVFGAHRLAAFQEAGTADILAMVFPAETSDEECFLAEIQENLARNDLTGVERKAFAAEVGRLSTVLFSQSDGDGEYEPDSDWFSDWRTKSGLAKNTAYDWWRNFTAETDRSITPKQATPEDKAAFFDWLEEAKAKADAEKAEKARKAEEEKQRKEEEAKKKRMAEEREEMMRYLDDTARMFDRKTIVLWLYEWIEGDVVS